MVGCMGSTGIGLCRQSILYMNDCTNSIIHACKQKMEAGCRLGQILGGGGGGGGVPFLPHILR